MQDLRLRLFPPGTGLLSTYLPHYVHYHHIFSRIDSLNVT